MKSFNQNQKEFYQKLNESNVQLDESSLHRLWSHNEEHDCGAMTAFRVFTECNNSIKFTRKENKARNLSLSAKLKTLGYSITKIMGKYPEGDENVKEVSYFIVDVNNNNKLKKDLINLGKEFNQDSILFIPKGAILNNSKEKATLYRTNDCKTNWMVKDGVKSAEFEKGKMGYSSKIYTSYIHGRPFIFEDISDTDEKFGSGFGAMYVEKLSKMNWVEIYERSINESSLNRIWQHWRTHAIGTITAFRNAKECNTGEKFTKSENKKNNSILKSKLLKLGYGVTKIAGKYIENYGTKNQFEVDEESFIVVDLKDSGRLKKDLVKLGSEFEQDSITYSQPAGKYYLISSNECPEGYPGYGKMNVELKLGTPMFGVDGEFYSKVAGRPFIFKESLQQHLMTIRDLSIPEIRGVEAIRKHKIIK